MTIVNRLIGAHRVVLVAVFVAVGLVYAWATPPFEASDEYFHTGMVEYIAREHSLPVQRPGERTTWAQEGSQPPLYYVMAAGMITLFDTASLDLYRPPNPHVGIGQPDSFRNKNFVVHDSGVGWTDGPLTGVYLIRALGILLGAVTVSAVYGCGRELAPDRPAVALLAAALVAFNPMFLFISASVNNDTLVTALASVCIYLLLRTLNHGLDARRSLLLAVLLALAALTKLSGLVLAPVAASVGLWVAYRDRDWRGLLTLGTLMAVAWVTLAGWWYARNLSLYDELFGTGRMVEVAGPRAEPFTLDTALDEFEGFRWSFWGVFGVFNIIVTSEWFYHALDLLMLTGFIGVGAVLWRLVRQRHGANARDQLARMLMLLAVLTVGFAAFLSWTAQTYASQGRLLFPYMAAIMPLTALGLSAVWGWVTGFIADMRARVALGLAPIGALAAVAIIIPFAVIRPAYRPPHPIRDLPPNVQPVFARFGPIDLVGYDVLDRRYEPGDAVRVTLYWQVNVPAEVDYSLFLSLIGPDGREIGKVDSYPGAGALRTSTWEPGLYADSYTIRLPRTVDGRFPLRLQVGWWHYPEGQRLRPQDASGGAMDAVVLNAGALAGTPPPVDERAYTPVAFPPTFGDSITLIGYQYNVETKVLRLLWKTTRAPGADYTVFVQALDETDIMIGQGDAPPPFPTRYWLTGEQYVTEHMLDVTDNIAVRQYRVIIGWYSPVDFSRLPSAYPESAYLLTVITRE